MKVKKVRLGYDAFGKMVTSLCEKVESFYESPKYGNGKLKFIHGIPNGGMAMALHMKHCFGLENVHCCDGTLFSIRNGKPYNLSQEDKKHMLLVDDIADTGETILEFFDKFHMSFMTATLYSKPHTKYFPDFYVTETLDWIVFPWEKFSEIPNREMYEHLGRR